MKSVNKELIVGIVQRALVDFHADQIALEIARLFPAPARVFLVGGFIRKAVLRTVHDINSSPRDLDFVVFGVERDGLGEYLKSLGDPQATTLGGAKLRIDNWTVDLWTPYQQIEVAGGEPQECTPPELLYYSTLTIDAVIFDCLAEELYEQGFLDAITEKTIDLGQSSKWIAKWAPYHLAHIASVWNSTRFKLSSRALTRIAEHDLAPVKERAIDYLTEHKKLENASALIDELICVAQEAQAEQTVP